MAKIDLTTEETTALMNCIETELKSVKRAQNTGKTPHIKEVYLTHQRYLEALQSKIAQAK